jgi:cellulose biosynthesis protein BcsQ
MLVACWSVKGGSGTTVVAATLGLVLASEAPQGAALVDLGGDVPAALGVRDPSGPGVGEWLAAEAEVGADALARLEVEVAPGLRLLPRGTGVFSAAGGERLAAALLGERHVVVDCGPPDSGAGLAVAGAAGLSLLVLRPCYLALRRALTVPIRPSGVILVKEAGRTLGRGDVEAVLGVPVRAEVAWDAAIARHVDAGLLAGHLPRALERALRRAA